MAERARLPPADQALSQLQLTLGCPEQAAEHTERAIIASRARNTPIFLGRELVPLASARARLGQHVADEEFPIAEALVIADRTEPN